ncbi:MAG: hypothetical protein H6943_10080 [Zoogloeaceae bacterium]|nr:hypothetical protein [Zoogloeaceae bacterium]
MAQHMLIRYSRWVFTIAAASALTVVAQAAPPATTLSESGYGKLRFGMTLAQAEQALGDKLIAGEGESPNTRCYQVHPKSNPVQYSLMIKKGRVARMTIHDAASDIRSSRGIGLGDLDSKVRQQYGTTLIDEEHEYRGPRGRYLTWWNPNGTHGLRYETGFDGHVFKIHAGDKSITLIEACS